MVVLRCHLPSNFCWSPTDKLIYKKLWNFNSYLSKNEVFSFGGLNMILFGFLFPTAHCSVHELWKADFMYLCFQVEVPCGSCTTVSMYTAAFHFPLKTFRTLITLRIMPLPNIVKISQLFQSLVCLCTCPEHECANPQREQLKGNWHYNWNW